MEWDAGKIKELRRRMGWSQSDLARRMNCDMQNIRAWEAEESFPEYHQLRLLELLERHADSCSEDVRTQVYADSVLENDHLSQIDYVEFDDGLPPSKDK